LRRWLAIAVVVGLVCCAVAPAAKPVKPVTPAYSIVPFVSPFAAPDGYNSVGSTVRNLNDCGQAVGFEAFSDGSSESVYQTLHLDIETEAYTLLPDGCLPSGVNNLNQLVGTRTLSDGRHLGMFLTDPDDTTPDDLGPLEGHTQSDALAINDAGVVVGYSWNDDGSSASAALWIVKVDEAGGVWRDGPWELPPLAGDARACAVDLNEVIDEPWCQVTGHSFGAADESYEAVVWTVFVNGTTATPGPAVTLVNNNAWSQGGGINDSGDVCGLVDVDGKKLPFLAPAGQTAQPLPVPRNTRYGIASDVNNLGEVVGQLAILLKARYEAHYAYLWKDGTMIDLETQIDPDSGWDRLWAASCINDPGIIAGCGSFDIAYRAFLLIPNPQ